MFNCTKILSTFFIIALSLFAENRDTYASTLLQKNAHTAFIQKKYSDAINLNKIIINSYPNSSQFQYAVTMLGIIYEDYIIDIEKAIFWHKKSMKNLANRRQKQVLVNKINFLNSLNTQALSYKKYKEIILSNQTPKTKAKEYEKLLKDEPHFLLKNDILKNLSTIYQNEKKYYKSYKMLVKVYNNNDQKVDPLVLLLTQKAKVYWFWSIARYTASLFLILMLFLTLKYQCSLKSIKNYKFIFISLFLIIIVIMFFTSLFYLKIIANDAHNPFTFVDFLILSIFYILLIVWTIILSFSNFLSKSKILRILVISGLSWILLMAISFLFLYLREDRLVVITDFWNQIQEITDFSK